MTDYIGAANAALAKRANIAEQRKAVLEDSTLSDAEKRSRYESMDAEMASLMKEADAHVRAAEAEVETRALNERAAKLTSAAGRGAPRESRDLAAEIRELATGARAEVVVDLRAAEKRAAGDGSTAQSNLPSYAGNTEATALFVNEVLEAMRFRSDFLNLARTMTTRSGEVLEWPVKNALNPATEPISGVQIQPENTPYTKGSQSWSKVNLGAYKYGVIVEATNEIVTDSELPILSILASDAGESVADAIMRDLMIGDGSGKPFGWLTRSTGAVSAASLSALTFDDLIDLQYSLTPPYRKNGVFMFTDSALPVLRKIRSTVTGDYVWQPATTAGQPDTILGRPFLTDPNISASGAGTKVAVYGDPKKYLIRQVNDLRIVRSDEYGFDRDVVAFKLTWRGTGDLFDLNSVKALTVDA